MCAIICVFDITLASWLLFHANDTAKQYWNHRHHEMDYRIYLTQLTVRNFRDGCRSHWQRFVYFQSIRIYSLCIREITRYFHDYTKIKTIPIWLRTLWCIPRAGQKALTLPEHLHLFCRGVRGVKNLQYLFPFLYLFVSSLFYYELLHDFSTLYLAR